MTKTILKVIAVILTVFLATYLVISFSLWNLNPAKWDEEIRFLTAMIGIIASGIACGILGEEGFFKKE